MVWQMIFLCKHHLSESAERKDINVCVNDIGKTPGFVQCVNIHDVTFLWHLSIYLQKAGNEMMFVYLRWWAHVNERIEMKGEWTRLQNL